MFKRVIAFLLFTVVLLSPITACSDTDKVRLGDVNDDGVINQYDYILVKRHYFDTYTLAGDDLDAADVNEDGRIDQYDYLLIARHYFGTYEIVDEPEEPELVEIPNVVSLGKLYTISPAPASNYEDTYNSELTDGVFDKSAGYTSGVFCGLNSNFEIVVDLGEDGKQLNKFELSYLSVSDAGINMPTGASVMVSDDSENWKPLGNMTFPNFAAGTVQRAVLELATDLSARYVKFEVIGLYTHFTNVQHLGGGMITVLLRANIVYVFVICRTYILTHTACVAHI